MRRFFFIFVASFDLNISGENLFILSFNPLTVLISFKSGHITEENAILVLTPHDEDERPRRHKVLRLSPQSE